MLPNITASQVSSLIPDAQNIADAGRGGQRVVFRGDIEGATYAIKFALLPDDPDAEDPVAEVETRAAREIEIMQACDSVHMVKLGPVGLSIEEVSGQRVLFFTEEFIDGQNLREWLTDNGPASPAEICRLGIEMADAISALWTTGKIHRDIKPKNIMRRAADGSFVLLDAGIAFDVHGESLSQGMFVGTLPYCPPERFDYAARRAVVDFRSDMFSLGVTMYQMATGVHPFRRHGEGSGQIIMRIMGYRPERPSSIRADIPDALDRVILRMLGKSPHLRFRTVDRLVEALNGIGGV